MYIFRTLFKDLIIVERDTSEKSYVYAQNVTGTILFGKPFSSYKSAPVYYRGTLLFKATLPYSLVEVSAEVDRVVGEIDKEFCRVARRVPPIVDSFTEIVKGHRIKVMICKEDPHYILEILFPEELRETLSCPDSIYGGLVATYYAYTLEEAKQMAASRLKEI